MVSSISAINNISTSSAAVSSSTALKNDTKKKLETLGLNPADYKTEAEAQKAIKETELTKAQQAQAVFESPLARGRADAMKLAADIGLFDISTRSISDMLYQLENQLVKIKPTEDDGLEARAKFSIYQTRYDDMARQYTQIISALNMTGANLMGIYNKAAFGI